MSRTSCQIFLRTRSRDRWSGGLHLASLSLCLVTWAWQQVSPGRSSEAGACHKSQVEPGCGKWRRMSPRDFHTENATLCFSHSRRNSGCKPGVSGDPECPGASDLTPEWPRAAARGPHHQSERGQAGTRDNTDWAQNMKTWPDLNYTVNNILIVKLNLLIKPWLILDLHHPRALSR